MSSRTFKVEAPHMRGEDVKLGQRELRDKLAHWGATDYPIEVDGDYGVATRSAYASVLYGLGIAQAEMAKGITPGLRSKIRNGELTDRERQRYEDRAGWRKRLAAKHSGGGFAKLTPRIISHSWGWTPPVHDGVDIITPARAWLYAPMPCEVIRVSASGWWGKGARPSGGHSVSEGDGIVVVRSTTDAGPFSKTTRLGFGHAENAVVRVGQMLDAGDRMAEAGFANAWHTHVVAHNRPDNRGIGDFDPWPLLSWAIEHS